MFTSRKLNLIMFSRVETIKRDGVGVDLEKCSTFAFLALLPGKRESHSLLARENHSLLYQAVLLHPFETLN